MITIGLIVFFFYLGLTANLAWNNLLLGAVLALFSTLLLRRAPRLAPDGHFAPERWPTRLSALGQYLWAVIKDVVVGGLQVARIAFSRHVNLKPGIIAIPAGCESELARALSAHAITLSPGEMVVHIENDTLYVHCLDATRAAQYSAAAQEMRQGMLRKIIR